MDSPYTDHRPTQLRRLLAGTLAAALVATLSLGCSDTPPAEEPAAPQTTDGGQTDQPAAESGDGDFAPISSRTPVASGAGTQVLAAGLEFSIPEGWTPEQPSSSMRAAQALIPGSAGPAQLTVFHFGPGGGGGVESNLQRWVGQVELEPGTSPIQDQITTRSGLRVTWVEVRGTLKPSTMGTGPTEPQPNSRLLGAVIEGDGGPWFFKATGPSDTLGEARDDFLAMLQAARLHGAAGPIS